ncbi:putative hydrolase of the HAD superfamily [Paenibacillus anaericanus]|uniref:HAD-IA family hydrolase n=1 Tax=Paenibacillus anaericanus TaxID=170367 RepID=UPI0027835349|nr:HAD-IA family hydrolase [Paenibacillus anaericanus]MDQ0088517.1 putative hydrolase of the HAD superfamily [Paenibacillus anaericanus]
MEELKHIKAILFDSGRVLNHPRTGHWFIPPNFFSYVDQEKFKLISQNKIEGALHKALQYMDNNPLIRNEAEEYQHFIHFYKIISIELASLELNREQIEGLAHDTVFNDDKFKFYEDVFKVIPELHNNYKLGVVSDTWPSLDRVFRNVGLRRYFSTFVMSSILGVVKPHELMFQTALTELSIKPEEALFVDDNIRNLEGARKLGIHTLGLLRDIESGTNSGHLCINNLRSLQQLLER